MSAECPYCGFDNDATDWLDRETKESYNECQECGKSFYWEVEFDPVFHCVTMEKVMVNQLERIGRAAKHYKTGGESYYKGMISSLGFELKQIRKLLDKEGVE